MFLQRAMKKLTLGGLALLLVLAMSTDAKAQFVSRMVDTTGASIDTVNEALAVLSGDLVTGGAKVVVSDTTRTDAVINYGGAPGNFGGDLSWPNGTGPGGSPFIATRENFAVHAEAFVIIPAGTWTVAVGSDDGFRLEIDGVTFTTRVNNNNAGAPALAADVIQFGPPRGHSVTRGVFTLGAPLTAVLNLDFFEQGGFDTLELSIASGSQLGAFPGPFQILQNGTLGWQVIPTPEPTSLALFGLCGAGLAGYLRRRKKLA